MGPRSPNPSRGHRVSWLRLGEGVGAFASDEIVLARGKLDLVGDLVLGTVKVANDFWGNAKDGGIRQTSGGTVTVGGKTTLIAKQGISLPDNNSFGGEVIVDGLPYDFGDNDVEIGDACYVEDDCIVVSEGVTDSELAELLKSL